MQKNRKRQRRWLPLVLERRTEFRGGREWSVEPLAPVTAADLRADGATFRRKCANAVLRFTRRGEGEGTPRSPHFVPLRCLSPSSSRR
jgi:hypothetical protein